MLNSWKGRYDFGMAQLQVVGILLVAYIGDRWPYSYPRNDNRDPTMFWVMNAALLVVAMFTLKHKENTRGVQLLSRAQTEEWKGWMQWAFIMYHYYRVNYVYNEIRVFVSAYVWMTGFGNFLYFEKKQDFSIDRMVSMWLRINYFPLLLCAFLQVKLELYYVVPLHTVGFFITMATCYVAFLLKKNFGCGYWSANGLALLLCAIVHVLFYETYVSGCLGLFDGLRETCLKEGEWDNTCDYSTCPVPYEYYFRFNSDKYSALVGIASGLLWGKFREYMNWAYGKAPAQLTAMWTQRIVGVGLIFLWFNLFGYMQKRQEYNVFHPYVFWLPVAGWLMVRNSSRYLTELHSTALEFLGRITLETYVLQFHVFMCQKVQHIPILIPGADANGPILLKTLNMLLCGSIFVPLALWARTATVTTQTTVVELLGVLRGDVVNSSGEDGVKLVTTGEETAKSSPAPAEPANEETPQQKV